MGVAGDCGSTGGNLGSGFCSLSGDLTSPASSIAACSSARVGNLMGDFVSVGTGDEEADCRPHSDVAFLTEVNVDFSGEGTFLAGEMSMLGVLISLSGVDFGLSAADFVGKVGNGRENREWFTADDGDGEGALVVSIVLGAADF